ncbi:hypothetical protein A4S06_10605 [Erysipelotrichaceae bacterium MTC7]|nr:hypothetical protein A4S06_10605 [Erysipelotrichaceae bacterium MTC7]
MKKTKLKMTLVVLCSLLFLVSCGKSDSGGEKAIVTEPIVAGDYKILKSKATNDTRKTHIDFNRGWYDVESVGNGLTKFSKEHFSPESYYMMEGQILSRDDLQVGVIMEDQEGLLGRKSEVNTYGLNPTKGTTMPINSAGTTITVGEKTTPIIDIFELDFVQEATDDPEVEGISFAIVLNPEVTDESGKTITIDDSMLYKIGEEASISLLDYLHKDPAIGNSKPICMTLFKAQSSDESLPGSFIGKGYGKESISFSEVNETWVVYPSTTADKLDPVLSTQFNSLKEGLFMIVPNDIGVIGRGKFEDDRLTKLQITVQTQAKTYTELTAILQTTNELLQNFDSDSYEISVRFINNTNEFFAMIQRDQGTKDTKVIYY